MVVPATLFEKFGFNYVGPIDGHDLESLIPTLEIIKQAVQAGELDTQIEQASGALRAGFAKKKVGKS